MKLIMCRGLPASGKSTYAKELVRHNGYKRINRDELREMIDSGKYSPDNEILIKTIRDWIVEIYSDNFNVVIDDTNLKPEDEFHFKDLAHELRMDFEVVEFITSVDECVRRDSFRGIHSVGEKVIRDLHRKYVENK